jgi:hypothetical protein
MPKAKISQNLSSDSVFHFIRRRDWLVNILKNKTFQARYVYEELPMLKYKVGIPMKCFCDIPLGMIKKHIVNYGKFGIGIKKEYAKKHKFSPVVYIHKDSDTLIRYLTSIKSIKSLNNGNSLLPYFKLVEGYAINSQGKKVFTKFYDEREWRYIPPNPDLIDFKGFDEEEIRNTKLEEENKNIDKDKNVNAIPFEYADITYLFVQYEEDVDKVIEEIHSLPITQLQQDRLIAKIITSRQIERDF